MMHRQPILLPEKGKGKPPQVKRLGKQPGKWLEATEKIVQQTKELLG
jgi:hypothetical protein